MQDISFAVIFAALKKNRTTPKPISHPAAFCSVTASRVKIYSSASLHCMAMEFNIHQYMYIYILDISLYERVCVCVCVRARLGTSAAGESAYAYMCMWACLRLSLSHFSQFFPSLFLFRLFLQWTDTHTHPSSSPHSHSNMALGLHKNIGKSRFVVVHVFSSILFRPVRQAPFVATPPATSRPNGVRSFLSIIPQ